MRRDVLPWTALCLIGGTAWAAGPDIVLDDPQNPTAVLADALVDVLVSEVPAEAVSVLYRDCDVQPHCAGQLPSWFDQAAWLINVEQAPFALVPLETTVGQTTLNRIHQTVHGGSDERVTALLSELQYAHNVHVLLVVRPQTTPTTALQWSVYDVGRQRLMGTGALSYALQEPTTPVASTPPSTIQPITPPIPPPPLRPPRPQRDVSINWWGVGVGVVGASLIGWSYNAYRQDNAVILTTQDAHRLQNPVVLTNAVGWAGLSVGTVMVTVPLFRQTDP